MEHPARHERASRRHPRGGRFIDPAWHAPGPQRRGAIGWFGPRPPEGDPPHGYHFQVLALDAMLDLPDGATREDLLANIDGRVVAKEELVATSRAPTQQ
ncbi:MAG: hypothetical protein M3Q11_01300 [Pseudomonadota bacterium]|nr:hypothetical protein [Pseudomonadota bacterium]